jgi:hypothetical protein
MPRRATTRMSDGLATPARVGGQPAVDPPDPSANVMCESEPSPATAEPDLPSPHRTPPTTPKPRNGALASRGPAPSMSDECRRVLAFCRRLGYGTTDPFDLRNGEPVLPNPLQGTIEHKCDGEVYRTRPLEPPTDADHNMIARLRAIGNATDLRVEVRHGLPFRVLHHIREGSG